jgi:hypothetical protein
MICEHRPACILTIVVMDSGLARFARALSDKRYALARGMTGGEFSSVIASVSEAIHLSAKQVWIAASRSLSSGAHSRDPRWLLAMTNSTAKLPDGQITSDFQNSCQAPKSKIFLFSPDPNQMHIQTVPSL